MRVSQITFADNQINNSTPVTQNRKHNSLKTAGYLAGGIVTGEGVFLTYDYFGERKDYKDTKIEINKLYEKEVADALDSQIEEFEKQGKTLTQKELETLKQFIETKMAPGRDDMMRNIKDYRQKYMKKWGLISAGTGLLLGLAAKFTSDYINKQKNIKPENNLKSQSTHPQAQTFNTDYYFYQNNKNKMINFTGVIEEYAHEMSPEMLEKLQAYASGANPTKKELQKAEKIASYRLRDWPKGIIKIKGIDSYFWNKYLPYRHVKKPSNDREYQMMILRQDFRVRPKPPKYYRLYEKVFKTRRYNSVMNDTGPYIIESLKFERMENLVNKIRLENYQKEKIMYDMQAKKQLSLACIKSKINRDFLIDFNSDDKNVNVTNAILIESKDETERTKNIQWIIAKANSHYVCIPDNGDTNDLRVNQIYNTLEEAVSNFQHDGKRTLLVVENFDKLLDKSPENEEIVGDLKDLLCKLNSEYHTTILFGTDDTTKMDPIALQSHRVTKYNLDREIPLEELKNFQNEFIKSNIRKKNDSDGYQYRYIPFQNKYIDLYLGDFGYSKNILWIDSSNTEQITAVLNNLDGIRMISRFKDINKVRFPQPENFDDLKDFKIINTNNKTLDNKYIFEYNIPSAH